MTGAPAAGQATSAQLKGDIDAGRTGDKVSGFDPAAAPLGTDEEAGGTPANPELLAAARTQERAAAPDSGPAQSGSSASLAPDGEAKEPGSHFLLAAVLGATAAILLGAIYYVLATHAH